MRWRATGFPVLVVATTLTMTRRKALPDGRKTGAGGAQNERQAD